MNIYTYVPMPIWKYHTYPYTYMRLKYMLPAGFGGGRAGNAVRRAVEALQNAERVRGPAQAEPGARGCVYPP